MTNFWKGKRVLVTGALGFLGSRILWRLQSLGAQVSGMDKYQDVRDIRLVTSEFSRSNPEVVFHLAAQALVPSGQKFPLETMDTNVMGTTNILEACRLSGDVRSIVVASTDKVYGRIPTPYSENSPLLGNEQIYEASKLCEDVIAHAYKESFDLPIVVTRCGNIYGPYDANYDRLIPGIIRAFIFNEKFVFRGPKSFRRDYNYIDDIVDGYLMCAENRYGDSEHKDEYAFNFGTGIAYNSAQIFSKIAEIFKHNISIDEDITATGEIDSQSVDATKARTILGWYPKIDLQKGLLNTIDWQMKRLTGEHFHVD